MTSSKSACCGKCLVDAFEFDPGELTSTAPHCANESCPCHSPSQPVESFAHLKDKEECDLCGISFPHFHPDRSKPKELEEIVQPVEKCQRGYRTYTLMTDGKEQFQCKNCNRFWFTDEEIPDCKPVEMLSVMPVETGWKLKHCSSCNQMTNHEGEKCLKCPAESGWEEKIKKSCYVGSSLIEANTVIDFIRDLLQKAKAEEREFLEKDMFIRMSEWHGTGRAMVEDYFKIIRRI